MNCSRQGRKKREKGSLQWKGQPGKLCWIDLQEQKKEKMKQKGCESGCENESVNENENEYGLH